MHKENNFSKYIHACYAFNIIDGNQLKLRKPVWWDAIEFTSPQMAVETGKSKRQSQEDNSVHWFANLLGLKPAIGPDGKPVKVSMSF